MKISLLNKIVLWLYAVSVLIFMGALYYLIWKANGEKLFPLETPLIPLDQWPENHRNLFKITLESSMAVQVLCYFYGITYWILKVSLGMTRQYRWR